MDGGFNEWYVRARPRVLAACVLMCGDLAVAEDAADEALLKALTRWDRVSATGSALGWTIQVALNLARRIERRRRLEAHLWRRDHEIVLPAPALELWSIVKDLPARQREVIVLKYLADILEDDIAALLGISRRTPAPSLTTATAPK